jgi:hypothetical protein
MNNCSNHSESVNGLSNPELATQIGDLRYDSLIELFNALSKKFEADSESDQNRGRGKLAKKLFNVSFKFKEMEMEMSEIWDICEPYMKK